LEDILPPEHNKVLLDLAYDMASWHAYAKLRVHTTHTIDSLRSQTKELGSQFRRFANKVCSQYRTKPLPGEAAARHRRRAAKAKKAAFAPTPKKPKPPSKKSEPAQGLDVKNINFETYKFHSVGDYADYVERFGPTDCFTTQQVRSSSPQSSPP